ncbi:uncharacterized protein L199_002156 [Kwoniella botswanensis]|uniref:uncharacterized protein n=1 Tax=Kwoniella botswanensis TaxID=1268659 RepID=UPI00315C8F2D
MSTLGDMGFTSEGVAADSAAADWQSDIGDVSAGSNFADNQSEAMSGGKQSSPSRRTIGRTYLFVRSK